MLVRAAVLATRGTSLLLIAAGFLLVLTPRTAIGQTPRTAVQQLPRMPNLRGDSLRVARMKIARMGLVLGRVATVPVSSTTRAGLVVDQKPDSGTVVKRGDSVTISVGRYQPPMRQVPDVRGQDTAAARRRLAASGFPLGQVSVRDSFDVPAARIIAQKPTAQDSALPRTPVDVQIASDFTIVPNLVRSRERDVPALLAPYSLVFAGATPVETAASPVGTVTRQSRIAGTRVPKGTSIGVYVAVAVQDTRVIVPALTDLATAFAADTLGKLGLRLGSIARSDASTKEAGIIERQNPPAGQRVNRNTAVDVVVATDSATVPRLVGLTIAQARDTLANKPLSLAPVAAAANARIETQTPDSGARVQKRSVVSVTLAIAQQPTEDGDDDGPPIPWVPVTVAFLAGAAIVAGTIKLKGFLKPHIGFAPPNNVDVTPTMHGNPAESWTFALAGTLEINASDIDLRHDGPLWSENER